MLFGEHNKIQQDAVLGWLDSCLKLTWLVHKCLKNGM